MLQFMNVCTERPVSLVPLDTFGLEPGSSVDNPQPPRTGKRAGGRRVGAMSAEGVPSLQHPTSLAVGSGSGLSQPGFPMGNFQPLPRLGDSQSRFDASNGTNQGDVGGRGNPGAKRTRARRGRNRRDDILAGGSTGQTANLEPLEQSENRQIMDRKVRALLNKITMGNFDSISDQILEWANESEQEQDGATLMRVVILIVEQAKGDAKFSDVYARLCRKMMDRISPNVQDDPQLRGSTHCWWDVVPQEITGLCTLLMAAGQKLDTLKMRNHMDLYFERMQEMTKSDYINFRMQFMLLWYYMDRVNDVQDVIELRGRHWGLRYAIPRFTPARCSASGGTLGRQNATQGSSRQGERHGSNATGGQGVTRGGNTTRPSLRAGDLSQFSRISRPTGIQFGPSSVFSKKDTKKQGVGLGYAYTSGTFSSLGGEEA
ncbi:hypothetical protein FRC11_011933 [Ceratobasidium sp. 423]|nr:hypothetical protein FRC11_011933 [Ceratobasidium sp. 423]